MTFAAGRNVGIAMGESRSMNAFAVLLSFKLVAGGTIDRIQVLGVRNRLNVCVARNAIETAVDRPLERRVINEWTLRTALSARRRFGMARVALIVSKRENGCDRAGDKNQKRKHHNNIITWMVALHLHSSAPQLCASFMPVLEVLL
jgi:hypothetical protein